MTFQFRVMQHRNKIEGQPYVYWVDIREVYYKDGAPKGSAVTPEWVEGWTAESSAPMSTHGENNGPLQGIVDDMKYYMLAMSLPILNEWELPGYKEDK